MRLDFPAIALESDRMAIMQAPLDAAYTHLYATCRGMSGSIYCVATGVRVPLADGVWLHWPGGLLDVLENGHLYGLACGAACEFMAAVEDVAELCALGAMRLDN
jgi:hypothetical protein